MLNRDFKDILLCLKNEEAEFIIVGAYALAAHGHPRATGDIDIWVRSSAENAQKVLRALSAFGAPISDLTEKDLTSPDMIVQFGVEPCRIDILTNIDGVEFDEAWKNKLRVIVDDVEVEILSRPDLLRNKLASGRDKDQSDIAWLQKH
jgi:Nucleotidyl transferase of unknown function (DUF2204)